MKANWFHDALSETNAAIALLGGVMLFAALIAAIFGQDLEAAWLVAAAVACLAVVFLLMYVKAARERDALIHTEVDTGVEAVELANADVADIPATKRSSANRPASVVDAASGRRTMNRVSPGFEVTDRSPWCLFTTMRHEMSRPRPVPSPNGFVVKNGSKMRPTTSSGMPGPVSPISTTMLSSTPAGADGQRAVPVHRL